MDRRLHRLTAKAVEKTKATGYHCDGGGLYLQVSPALTKSWIFRYTRVGKTREMGLGSLNAVDLDAARKKAYAYRGLLADGKDPKEERDAQTVALEIAKRRSVTFSKYAEDYIAAQVWENAKTPVQWRNTLKEYANPVIGTLPVHLIEKSHVLQVLKPIWREKRETAERVRRRIARILDSAKFDGFRTGDNPAAWEGNLKESKDLPSERDEVEHFTALPWGEVGTFMQELRAQSGIAARALELTILTAVRTHVTLGAVPEEFDLDKGEWIIPKERMKGRKGQRQEHRVPLSKRALELVKERIAAMEEGNGYLFPGDRPGQPLSNMAMLKLLQRMKRDVTVHGFRSTFRDWASEATHHDHHAVEKALAHSIPSKVEAAYRRGDLFEKRRRLMDDWAMYCAKPKSPAKVVPMKRKTG